MEQRPLRLGDVVDDYCPRERRVTNHVIVAIVEDVIRQTRCSTCESDHPYKSGREPRLRKKLAAGATDPPTAVDAAQDADGPALPESPPVAAAGAADATDPAAPRLDDTPAADDPDAAPERAVDGWLSHRPLIRATLPRTEGEPPAPRPIPEFTMHQRQPRGGRGFRFFGNGNAGGGNGNGPARGNFGQGRPGKPSGRRHRGGKRPR
jgi:hypothetical protein